MTMSEKLTNLANNVRDVSNISQKLSLDDMAKEVSQMSGLSNFFLAKVPTMSDGKGHTSTPHGAAQRFSNQGGFTGELVKPSVDQVTMNVFKGDTITQSVVIKSDGDFKDLTFNFNTDKGYHVIYASISQLDSTTHKATASYTVDADTNLTLLNFWCSCKGGSYVEVSQPYAAITKIGGVIDLSTIDNLLLHSDTFEGWSKNTSISVSTNKYLCGDIAVLDPNGTGSNCLNGRLSIPYGSQQVTWSVYAKADYTGDKLHTELFGGGGISDLRLTTDWKLYQFTGTTNANNPILYFWGIVGNKGNVEIALPYAVIGTNISNGWNPNPNDKTS